jgi:mercuric ion transport protein
MTMAQDTDGPVVGKNHSLKGYLLLSTAALTCPCHLPILIALTAGTAFGAFVSDHLWFTGLLLTLYFASALYLGLKWLGKEKAHESEGGCDEVL